MLLGWSSIKEDRYMYVTAAEGSSARVVLLYTKFLFIAFQLSKHVFTLKMEEFFTPFQSWSLSSSISSKEDHFSLDSQRTLTDWTTTKHMCSLSSMCEMTPRLTSTRLSCCTTIPTRKIVLRVRNIPS